MSYLTKEQLLEAVKNPPKATPEERQKARELGKKLKSLSPEERRKMVEKLDKEKGYC